MSSKEIPIKLVSQNSKILTNKKLALEEVTKDHRMLENLSAELRDDKEIVHIAILQNGLALEYVSERLRDDEDLVYRAIIYDNYGKSAKSPFMFASNRIKGIIAIASAAIAKTPDMVKDIKEPANDDYEFMI